MHVHIDEMRIAIDEQHRRRIPARGQDIEITRPQRPGQQLVAHRPCIDEDMLRHRRPARIGRQRREAGQPHPVALGVNGNGIVDEIATHHPHQTGMKRVEQIALLGIGAKDQPVTVVQREPDRGFGHGQPPHDLGNRLRLGAFAAQEFQPRRGGEEQVAQLDHGAAIGRGRAHRLGPASGHADLGPLGLGARGNTQPTDRAEAGQRLAPETEAVNIQQIGPVDLRGRMTRQRQRQILGAHAAAVIDHPDQRLAALRDGHVDPPRPGIERVFHQFLHRRGRTLDHLARRDAVGDAVVQLADNRAYLGVVTVHGPISSSSPKM